MNSKDLKKLQQLLIFAIGLAILSISASIVKNIVIERWAKLRDQVACVPADIQGSYPMVYAQTATNPVQSDSAIKSFVTTYIKYSLNEQIVDYHSLSSDGRYSKIKFSDSLLKAVEMTMPGSTERAIMLDKYGKSADVLERLRSCDCGWVFLVDDLLVYPDSVSGTTLVVVRGEFQVTYDKIKKDLPDELWGYREIHYLVEQSAPSQDAAGNFLNEKGLYISSSNIKILTQSQKEERMSRSHNYYMKEHDQ